MPFNNTCIFEILWWFEEFTKPTLVFLLSNKDIKLLIIDEISWFYSKTGSRAIIRSVNVEVECCKYIDVWFRNKTNMAKIYKYLNIRYENIWKYMNRYNLEGNENSINDISNYSDILQLGNFSCLIVLALLFTYILSMCYLIIWKEMGLFNHLQVWLLLACGQ